MPIIMNAPYRAGLSAFYDDFGGYGGNFATAPYTAHIVDGSDPFSFNINGANPTLLASVPSDELAGGVAQVYDNLSFSNGIVRSQILGVPGGGGAGNTQPGLCGRFVDDANFTLLKPEFAIGLLRVAERRSGFPNYSATVAYAFTYGIYYYLELDYTNPNPVGNLYSNSDYTGLLATVTLGSAQHLSAGKAGMLYTGDTNSDGFYDDLYIIPS